MAQPQMPRTKHWRFQVDVQRLGWLTIDTPKAGVNTLGREAISELETLVSRFEDLVATEEIAGIILLSGKESGFIAGADISEFDAMSDFSILPEALKRTHSIFQNWPWPAITASRSTTRRHASAFPKSIWASSPALAAPAARSARPGRSMRCRSCSPAGCCGPARHGA
jgi:hypothetical protein